MLKQKLIWIALFALCLSQEALAQNSNSMAELNGHPGWVQVPGMLVRPDCLHQLPNGATVMTQNNKITGDVTLGGALFAHYDACPEAPVFTRPMTGEPGLSSPPGTGNGWVEGVQKNLSLATGDNIDLMSGTWTVPGNPPANGALIYLWNGIEPPDNSWVLQPVLQWGSGPYFGGDYWMIASWLVSSDGNVFVSTPARVYSGDSIWGWTQLVSDSGANLSWVVQAFDQYPSHFAVSTLAITTSSAIQWNLAYAGVLEVYYLNSCSQLPSGVDAVFSGSTVEHGYPNAIPDSTLWNGEFYNYGGYGGPSCNYWANPVGSSADLFWNVPPLKLLK